MLEAIRDFLGFISIAIFFFVVFYFFFVLFTRKNPLGDFVRDEIKPILDNWLKKRALTDQYNHMKYILFKTEGEFQPVLSERFWMRYNVHFEVLDRKKFKKNGLLEEGVRNREGFLNYIHYTIESVIDNYYIEFPRYPQSHFPNFYDITNYPKYITGKERELKIKKIFINDFWNTIKSRLEKDSVAIYGVKPYIAIDKEFIKGGKMEENLISNDIKKLEGYLEGLTSETTDKPPAFQMITAGDLEEIKKRFETQFKFQSRWQNEKLSLLLKHTNDLIDFEKSKSRLHTIEVEKRVDFAKKLVELKELEIEMLKLEKKKKEVNEPKPDDSVIKLKEELEIASEKERIQREHKRKKRVADIFGSFVTEQDITNEAKRLEDKIIQGRGLADLSKEELRMLDNIKDAKERAIDEI